ncbi:helix-turn-helix transcriptional regulator [Mycolicibacter longobardus]|uniref:XRE family transcriptional regulator n=1 Tax=Mycolicibacter longobardus TaxID=1108812 RepID=A0A1X1YK99_9MYCO|nr:helix-turn-helix transcriptional regulator [Mycolicibacter longobardus]MCV7383909.1 helix-turn-helix domain-containing protein [Mycolicibacter longobardus]ORW11518.1 XRE family transcriptional regulator [Mycolicibacter longobardus]
MNASGVPERTDIRDFLATRRARISPEQVGLPAGGTQRRVPGLRREEVAVLAGVSTDWYTRLEKGHIRGVSDDVLSAVARALLLDDAETAHLFHLARAAKPARTPRRRTPVKLPASLQQLLDAMTGAAVFVRNGRLDIIATNALGRALYAPVLDEPAWKANIARFNFLDERAADFFPDYAGSMDTTVALLRTEAGRDPYNKDLTELIGELATRSEHFRSRWGTHNVRSHNTGLKHFNHPVVGAVDLSYDSLDVRCTGDDQLVLTGYTAPPGSPADEKLRMLASWSAPTSTARAEEHDGSRTAGQEPRS